MRLKQNRYFRKIELNEFENNKKVMILPLGEIKGRDGRYWILSAEDAQSLIDTIKTNNVDIVLDFAHRSYDYPADETAAGWFLAKSFELREDGIYAELELTQKGLEAVNNKEYRYLSPVFWSNGTRIIELESVGLTNIPNITDIPALNKKTNNFKEDKMSIEELMKQKAELEVQLNDAKSKIEKLTTTEKELNKIRKERDDALVELNKVKGELEAIKKKEFEKEINEMVENAIKDGKLAPAQKETAVKIGLNSKEALEDLIKSSPYDFRKFTEEKNKPKGTDENKTELDDTTLEVCKMLDLKAEDIKKNIA